MPSTHEPDPKFLTIPQAAERLNVSARFIERLIASRDLPVHRFGRAVRIKCTTLDALAEKAERSPLRSRDV